MNNFLFHIFRFRWDLLNRFRRRGGPFRGFDKFLDGGVQTEYLTSVFPSESFPAWQTINTGNKETNRALNLNCPN